MECKISHWNLGIVCFLIGSIIGGLLAGILVYQIHILDNEDVVDLSNDKNKRYFDYGYFIGF